MNDKKNISVCFTADQFHKFSDGKSTVVVVDLLRAYYSNINSIYGRNKK